jgi:Uma2 family endonuclease
MRLHGHGVGDERTLGAMATPQSIRHVRPVQPLHFPSSDPEWDMPESWRHGRLCDLLFQILVHALGRESSVGKDNFIYFDASNPSRRLAPDAFVKLRVAQEPFNSWKTWQMGTPEVCVEILSPSDTKEKLTLKQKLERYRALGTPEVIAFNRDYPEGKRLRAWDRIEDDLVERVVDNETTPCLALRAHLVLSDVADLGIALRLAHDPAGTQLWLSSEEAAVREVATLRAQLAKAK